MSTVLSESSTSLAAELAAELDAIAKTGEGGVAANDAGPERRQLDLLLLHALQEANADYAFVLSPAGEGAYAEQFIKLAAVAERSNEGQLRSWHDSLVSRRADKLVLSVMNQQRGLCGKPTDIGLPDCLPGAHPPIRYYMMLPIESEAERPSILFVANPSGSPQMRGQGGLMQRLASLLSVYAERQSQVDTSQQSELPQKRSAHSDARHYVQLMSACMNAVVITDMKGIITAFNPAAEGLFDCSSTDALGCRLDRYLSQAFIMPVLKRSETFESPTSTAEMLSVNRAVVDAQLDSGTTLHLNCSAYYTRVHSEVYTTFVFEPENHTVPLTDSKATHQQFEALTNVAPVAIVQLGADWTCDYANEMWCRMGGLSIEETLGEGWVDAIHAEDVVDTLVELRECLSQNKIFSRNIRLQRPTGKVSWVTLSATVTTNEKGQFTGCLLVLLDVTEAHLASEKLRFAATHDVLTSLANRSAFLDTLQARLNDRQTRSRTALLYLDLDGFKAVNDTLGHDCGDELLREVADRLKACVGGQGLCARLGGDEFTVIVNDAVTLDVACELAERIVRRFSETYHVLDNELHLSTSIGIAYGDPQIDSSDNFIKQADTALYKAKSSGRSRWVVYTREFQHEDIQRSVLQGRVRRATEKQEFTLAYQPQFRVADRSITGFEALLRWHPSDINPPDTQSFVDILEETGLINEVGQWVLETACKEFKSWEVAGLLPDECMLSVNVSAAQLSMANFGARLKVILQRCNVQPRRLNLEITESTLIEKNSSCIRVINELKEFGVSVSLDDFGTGYASLSYLTRLPIDYLKIDKSFVLNMNDDESSRTIVMSVLAMAGTLDIDVVAEGVETEAALAALKESHCEYAQGFLFCEPLAADALVAFLVKHSYATNEVIDLAL